MSPLPGDHTSLARLAKRGEDLQEALIRENSILRNRPVLRLALALDNAATIGAPYFVNDPFNAFLVESATDNNTAVQLAFSSGEASNTLNYVTLKANVSAKLDIPVAKAVLLWASQPGKTMNLILFMGVQLFPGSFLQQISGGVNVLTGSSMATIGNVSIATAPAQQILASDSTRKRSTLTVLSGGTVYIGGGASIVGATGAIAGTLTGIPLPIGASYEITHQGAVFAVTDSGTSLVAVSTEV